MSYSEELKNPGLGDKALGGRKSWKGAQNQAEGNLRWSLDVLSPAELIAKMAEIETQDYLPSFSKPKKRLKYLKGLKQFHEDVIERLETEIERTKAVISNSEGYGGEN